MAAITLPRSSKTKVLRRCWLSVQLGLCSSSQSVANRKTSKMWSQFSQLVILYLLLIDVSNVQSASAVISNNHFKQFIQLIVHLCTNRWIRAVRVDWKTI